MNKEQGILNDDLNEEVRRNGENHHNSGENHNLFKTELSIFGMKILNAMMSKFDLDVRLIQFACIIIDVVEILPHGLAGSHLASQLIRSGTSPALNYGEAQGAESRKDFIHKMKIALKELRETFACLRIIQEKKWLDQEKLSALLDENNQLIAIFVKSIDTAEKNIALNRLK